MTTEHEPTSEAQVLKSLLEDALYPREQSTDSVFTILGDGNIVPSESLLDREQELRGNTELLCQILDDISQVPPDRIRTPVKKVELQPQGYTYSSVSIEVTERKGHKAKSKYGKDQVFVSETASVVTGDSDIDADNWENQIRSQEARLVNDHATLMKINTEKAADKQADYERRLDNIRTTQLETVILQLQEVDGREYHPKVGVKIIRTLKGVQAYPVIFQGREALVVNKPLLRDPAQETYDEELGIIRQTSWISEEAYKEHPISKLVAKVTRKAGL